MIQFVNKFHNIYDNNNTVVVVVVEDETVTNEIFTILYLILII